MLYLSSVNQKPLIQRLLLFAVYLGCFFFETCFFFINKSVVFWVCFFFCNCSHFAMFCLLSYSVNFAHCWMLTVTFSWLCLHQLVSCGQWCHWIDTISSCFFIPFKFFFIDESSYAYGIKNILKPYFVFPCRHLFIGFKC